MEWLKDVTENNVATWTIVSQEIVTGDRFSPDYEDALEKLEDEKVQTQFYNIVNGSTAPGNETMIYDYSNSPTKGGDPLIYTDHLREVPLDRSTMNSIVVDNVKGRYNITGRFDDWEGYIADRERMLDALSKSKNPIVLSGDSHGSLHLELVISWIGKLISERYSKKNDALFGHADAWINRYDAAFAVLLQRDVLGST